MAVRSSRSGSRYLALEVWLGPMEGQRHTADCSGPSVVVRIGRRRADEKKSLRNDFVLAEGEGISGFHAEVRCEGGTLFLKDLKSTNGTFWNNHPINGETEIRSGDIFLFSVTPVRAELTEEPRAEVAPALETSESLGGGPAKKVLEAAWAASARRGESYVDSRHLCEGILSLKDSRVEKTLREANWTMEKAVAELWGDGLYRGPNEWLRRFLKAPLDARASGTATAVSPRVHGFLALAEASVGGSSPEAMSVRMPAEVFAILLQSPEGAVGGWLRERGVRVDPSFREPRPTAMRRTVRAGRATRTAEAASGDGTVGGETVKRDSAAPGRSPESRPRPAPLPRAAQAAPSPTVAPVRSTGFLPPRTTGDAALDRRAREIAGELEEAATLYRFSTVEDRRSVLKTLVTRSLAAIAPANRTKILEQIRIQFPVLDAPPQPPGETSRLHSRIRELEERLEALRVEGKSAARAGPEKSSERTAAAFGNEELVRETLDFARNIEKFLLGLIQAVTMPGNSTMSFRLPSQRYTLDAILTAAKEGKELDLKKVTEYLRELERWQVAILAAHHESPKIWFEKLWKRLGPAAIEAAPRSASWKLRGEAAEWWNRYKEAAKGLNAEVVQDQVLQTAYRFAQEEFEKLSKRRQP
jgi:FHA domain